jgi:glycerophosphoryl diester phosphodiesterase
VTAFDRTLRLAHRGDWRRERENTIAAFRAALAVPACDGLEFDVRRSADGVPVICHDVSLERVQRRPERVDALTAAELADLDVPTLAEVLEAVGRRPFLDVELKGDPGPAVVEVLTRARGPDLEGAVVSSFDGAALERVHRLRPGWPLWLNSHLLEAMTIADALALGCQAICVDWWALDQGSIERARAAGLEVASFTVRHQETFERLAQLGVVAVCVEGAALDG